MFCTSPSPEIKATVPSNFFLRSLISGTQFPPKRICSSSANLYQRNASLKSPCLKAITPKALWLLTKISLLTSLKVNLDVSSTASSNSFFASSSLPSSIKSTPRLKYNKGNARPVFVFRECSNDAQASDQRYF